MSVTDLINDILDHDVRVITFGRVPENPGLFFASCEQTFGTGGPGCFTKLNHQKIDKVLVVALTELRMTVVGASSELKDQKAIREVVIQDPPPPENERPAQS